LRLRGAGGALDVALAIFGGRLETPFGGRLETPFGGRLETPFGGRLETPFGGRLDFFTIGGWLDLPLLVITPHLVTAGPHR
jgi:hypothetical protein